MSVENKNYHIYPPAGSLDLLSKVESDLLTKSVDGELYQLFRNCLLAVLNTGSQTDDASILFQMYKDFEAKVSRTERGIKLELMNPPQSVFVDGELTRLIRTNLFSVLRDILYMREVV
ncbi:MAG: pyrimidine/purine nucleosidase domain-containing protein, partial [Wohlfahrtiimonas sp.]